MASLLKSSLYGLSGSSFEAVAEGAGRATGEIASEEGARPERVNDFETPFVMRLASKRV